MEQDMLAGKLAEVDAQLAPVRTLSNCQILLAGSRKCTAPRLPSRRQAHGDRFAELAAARAAHPPPL